MSHVGSLRKPYSITKLDLVPVVAVAPDSIRLDSVKVELLSAMP